MAPLDECSILLPSATLEDFPTGGRDTDARSLLAGWTVLWHPLLLAQTEQMPTWYRADVPPTPDGPRVILVPTPSLNQVPSDFRLKCDANPDCLWVTGANREEMLEQLPFDPADPATAPLEAAGRQVGVEDFYAAGYLSLQIQIMTRRLRYTSNLDELFLQSRITAAAKAFRDRKADETVEALHEVFDCLSEERDHYFSSDPALIDLTLLTPSVLDSSLAAGWLQRFRDSARAGDENAGVLATPRNLLIDGSVASQLCGAGQSDQDGDGYDEFRQLISEPTIGWAGGGVAGHHSSSTDRPDTETTAGDAPNPGEFCCLDAMTLASARRAFESGTSLATRAMGTAPSVFAQLSGATPVDLLPALAELGYKGVVPIDFTGGTGFGDESKVLVSAGGLELEALTAKPIDAASDAAFLSLGAHLGEAIDTGEVATGLLVHWPDRVCETFMDLCRAATWSVALGRFWTLEGYFTEGERPYHHGNLSAVSAGSALQITEALAKPETRETLQTIADRFADTVRRETRSVTAAIAMLAKPELGDALDESAERESVANAPEGSRGLICRAVGIDPERSRLVDKESVKTGGLFCFNPHGAATRRHGVLDGGGPPKEPFVYAATDDGGKRCQVTFDVPATGFTRLAATGPVKKPSLLKRLTGVTGIAEASILRNQFMAVSLDEATGGIAGVFSASRGNRLSVKLVGGEKLTGDHSGGTMVCRDIQTARSDLAAGIIEVQGELLDVGGKSLAEFSLAYQLQRGSRLLYLEGSITPKTNLKVESAAEVWNSCFAIRTAVAGEASIMRGLVRDKVHSVSTKKFVAPLGVLIDEAEKQTLVVGHGLPLHRKVGDRFLDTLIARPASPGIEPGTTTGQTAIPFRLAFALDSPCPVAIARSCIAPAEVLALDSAPSGAASQSTSQAWLIHVSAADVLITEMSTRRRSDGKLATNMQLVRTRPKTSSVRIQFCVHAHAAFLADASGIDRLLEDLPENVTCNDGVVELTLGHHEVADLVVVFDV